MSELKDINPNISVDCVIFGFDGQRLNVLLIQEKDIGQGILRMRLPGDLIHRGEGLDESADRVLWELSSLKNVHLQQFHTFGDPVRVNGEKDRKWLELYRANPNERVVTVAYYALVKMVDFAPNPSSFAGEALWVNIREIPELAFDHNCIVDVALTKLQRHFELNKTAYELLPPKFTLNQLQQLHEAITQEELDKRNFRKKIVREKMIEATEEKQKGVLHKPARLYRVKSEDSLV
ncbi:MAG TPA: NUDIX hydrolase [Cryomorphaceae bacterium]|nr:NUDIX hydrolase [Cryomorphaceae bacterium]|tara:strand:+ start:1606 stop:2310 length:705 start_codon:yes stop_codon:yes gene_type:complete